MKKSSFQFQDPCLRKLEFHINDGYKVVKRKKTGINLRFQVRNKQSEDKPEAVVELEVQIGDQEEAPFWIVVVEGAYFKWDDDMEQTQVDKFLNQNAPALLLSYMRPIVASMTAATQYNAYNIPFINFKDSNQ